VLETWGGSNCAAEVWGYELCGEEVLWGKVQEDGFEEFWGGEDEVAG
jgi:hypothetical protein